MEHLREKDLLWGDPSNSLMRLHEVFPGKSESYKFSEGDANGPSHDPQFTCLLQFEDGVAKGRDFTGTGRSKQYAKRDAAEVALHTLFHEGKLPENYTKRMTKIFGSVQESVPPHRPQGTAMASLVMARFAVKRERSAEPGPDGSLQSIGPPGPSPLGPPRKKCNPEKSPLQLLNNKLGSDKPTWEHIDVSGPSHEPVYKVKLCVKESEFIGQGGSKRNAKADAARQALLTLYDVVVDEAPAAEPPGYFEGNPSLEHPPAGPVTAGCRTQWPHCHSEALANHVQEACVKKFSELREGLPDAHQQFKVLAGVVQLRGGVVATEAETTVVSLATGTKCIHGDNLCNDGSCVNDCHAEVLARRGLCAYFHDQIRRTTDSESTSIFERVCSNGRDMFVLNHEVSFHLFISTAPCGDARVFLSGGDQQASGDVAHRPSSSYGKLRCKVEAGEGTILSSDTSPVQTLDGLAAGQRLHTMSCSDKVARWNSLGVQGCLLSDILLQPIYFDTVTIGDMFQYEHMYRALYDRLSSIYLPRPFLQNKPFVAKSKPVPEELIASRSLSSATDWFLPADRPEVINCAVGKCLDGSASRLCKVEQARRFRKTCAIVGLTISNQLPTQTYSKMKLQCVRYQECKSNFMQHMSQKGLGSWFSKPAEHCQFVP